MRALIFSLCILASAPALALTSYSQVEMVRVGNRVVKPGDDFTKIRADNPPDNAVPLINAFGVKRGEELWYDRGNGSYTVIRVDNYGHVTATLDLISR